jgi:hypothetical protein
MADVFFIKRGDTSPSLIYALLPVSVDLTGATVRFNMRARSGTVVVNRQAAVIVTASGTPTVRYDWQSADVASAGFYEAEFEVTYTGGAIETFPNDSFIGVSIGGDIA